MEKYQALKKYFFTGTTEGEKDILSEAFVPTKIVESIVSSQEASPIILMGNKGTGKTAVLERLMSAFDEAQNQVNKKKMGVLLRPDDIDLGAAGLDEAIGQLKATMYRSLVYAIAVKIGVEQQKKNVKELSQDEAELLRIAIDSGHASEKIAITVGKLLSEMAKQFAKIDLNKYVEILFGSKPGTPWLRQNIKSILKARGDSFFLFFDDTDQIAPPNPKEYLNRIWALLLALRKISNDMPWVKCIVTLRPEVWRRLQKDPQGQWDQVDHFRNLIINLAPNDDDLASILDKRLELAYNLSGGRLVTPYDYFFEGEEVVLPLSKEKRKWKSLLIKNSRNRPRDIIQLVWALAETARSFDKINSSHVERAMYKYSTERAEDLAKEFTFDCPNLFEIIQSFCSVDFELSFEEMRNHVSKLPSRFSISVRGEVLGQDKQESFIKILRILFEGGFLNARREDDTQPKGFRHITFTDEPNLIESANWNLLQQYRWEIHPAYHSFLVLKKNTLGVHTKKKPAN